MLADLLGFLLFVIRVFCSNSSGLTVQSDDKYSDDPYQFLIHLTE
jgi:hypothetical protein